MRVLMLMVLLLTALTGCGGEAAPAGGDDQAPVAQVEAFVAATRARDIDAMVALLTPDTRRDARWQLEQAMASVQSIEYTNPSFLLSENDGTTAYVLVAGNLSVQTTDNQTVEQPVNQLIELQKIDGTWLISSNGIAMPLNP